ncbi:unnamed protein product [Arctogadus glacialis]
MEREGDRLYNASTSSQLWQMLRNCKETFRKTGEVRACQQIHHLLSDKTSWRLSGAEGTC